MSHSKKKLMASHGKLLSKVNLKSTFYFLVHITGKITLSSCCTFLFLNQFMIITISEAAPGTGLRKCNLGNYG